MSEEIIKVDCLTLDIKYIISDYSLNFLNNFLKQCKSFPFLSLDQQLSKNEIS